MKFSLLVPTRDRSVKLDRLFDSIYKMSHRKKNLEILVACDDDDKASQNHVKKLKSAYSPHLKIDLHIRSRSQMLNQDYYNWLGEKATGDMIWVLADDLELTAPGWDIVIGDAIQHFFDNNEDKIVCCSILDNTPPPSHRYPKFPCFPMFSKEAKDACGWLLHPTVPNWGADYICYTIYKPIGRLLEFKDRNYINHVCWHNKQERPDSISERIGQIFNKLKMIPKHNTDRILSEECPKISERLLSIITNYQRIQEEIKNENIH